MSDKIRYLFLRIYLIYKGISYKRYLYDRDEKEYWITFYNRNPSLLIPHDDEED